MTNLQRAARYLRAYPYGPGLWAYDTWDRRYIVQTDDMRLLGRALRRHDRRDAYALWRRWCTETVARSERISAPKYLTARWRYPPRSI
jgi:hypothetical protein